MAQKRSSLRSPSPSSLGLQRVPKARLGKKESKVKQGAGTDRSEFTANLDAREVPELASIVQAMRRRKQELQKQKEDVDTVLSQISEDLDLVAATLSKKLDLGDAEATPVQPKKLDMGKAEAATAQKEVVLQARSQSPFTSAMQKRTTTKQAVEQKYPTAPWASSSSSAQK